MKSIIILTLFLPFLLHSMTIKKSVSRDKEIVVKIQGGTFTPDVIGIPQAKETKVSFLMLDKKLCREKIIIKGLNINIPLSLNKMSSIKLNIKKAGKYHIECESGAFCGVMFVIGKNESQHIYSPDSN